jgi:hypothetical protein
MGCQWCSIPIWNLFPSTSAKMSRPKAFDHIESYNPILDHFRDHFRLCY